MYGRELNGKTLEFGHMGILYQNSFIMYDRGSESHWVHTTGKCVKGMLEGSQLEFLPSVIMPWGQWKMQNPETTVLTGRGVGGFMGTYSIDRNPANFGISVGSGEAANLYRISDLKKHRVFHDKLEGQSIVVFYDADGTFATAWKIEENDRFTFDGEGFIDSQGAKFNMMLGTRTGSSKKLKSVPATAWLIKRWKGFYPDRKIFKPVKLKQKTNTSKEDAKVAPLISAEDLELLIKSRIANIRLIEAGRDQAEFASGHIPQANFVHWIDDMINQKDTSNYGLPEKKQFENLMSRLGVSNEDRIIIYDRLSSRLSTRLFWTLKFFGHENVQILDGGFDAWTSNYSASKNLVELVATEYKVTQENQRILARLKFVEECLSKPNARIIDGRPSDQFTGKVAGRVFHTEKEHPRKGHIPGAINVVWKDNFDEDGKFRSVEELESLYENAGLSPDQCVITYCNEGLHAAPPWFVLTQILNFKDVRVYDSSMAEWAKLKTPIEKVEK